MNDADAQENVVFYVIEQGADWNERVQLENDDGSPVDLSGGSVQLDVFVPGASPASVLSLSSDAGTMALDGASGQINWIVPAAQTAQMQPSPGVLAPAFGFDPLLRPFGFYVLRAKWPTGQIFRELRGQVALLLGSTSNL